MSSIRMIKNYDFGLKIFPEKRDYIHVSFSLFLVKSSKLVNSHIYCAHMPHALSMFTYAYAEP